MRIGIIGLDSTHTTMFCKLFEDRDQKIIIIFDDFLSDRPISINRRTKIKESVNHIPHTANINDLEEVDVILMLNVDADLHYHYLNLIKDFDAPVFIDKPLAYSPEEAKNIIDLVNKYNLRVFSSSALRYCNFVKNAKEHMKGTDEIIIYGPLTIMQGLEGLYWYAIHCFEILHTLKPSRITSISGDVKHISGVVECLNFQIIDDEYFSIKIDDKIFKQDQSESIYEGLIEEIEKFVEGDNVLNLEDTLNIIKNIKDANNKLLSIS